MSSLLDLLWIEFRKARRSGMLVWTSLASLFMPLGIAFLIFVSKNSAISQKLGLVSAKADLVAFAATDWPTYLGVSAQILAAGGFIVLVLAVSWVFGREFADGTLKDLLAVPVPRLSLLLAKFVLVAVWCVGLSLVIWIAGLATGALLNLPGGSSQVVLQGSGLVLKTAFLVIGVVFPFAFFASVGRGYLLPIGLAILALMLANLVVVIGWGEYFPLAVPMLYAQGENTLPSASYLIVLVTALAGILATYLWWMRADQSR